MFDYSESIKNLGFSDSYLDEYVSSAPESCVPARVLSVHKESYVVSTGDVESYAEITGKLMFGADSPLDLPVTGDWCLAQFLDDGALAIIHEVLPRKSLLKRKTPGKKTEFQAIAANIDSALLVQSVDDDFSLRRLERYLVMTRDAGIEPVVLLSKCDLISPEETEARVMEVKTVAAHAPVFAFSNESGIGIKDLDGIVISGSTYCVLGSSGVGKSTLINRFAGREIMETSEIREKDSKGRHTTTARQLILLDSGVLIIDTPGMRELASIGASDGIAETFDDIVEFEKMCRFSDCTHRHETGCAVLKAVENGEIDVDRFENYNKMLRENAHNESTFLEKRKKDKSLHKLYKSIQKSNKKNQ